MTQYPEKGVDRPDPMAFGAGLPAGLGVNLLTPDVARSARFQAEVLGAEVVYWEDHFAVLRGWGSLWQLHSDWSYRAHEMQGVVAGLDVRGAGIELRLYGCDPDAAEERARAAGAVVLSGAVDKPHGLRECHIVDADGYVWVPSRAIS